MCFVSFSVKNGSEVNYSISFSLENEAKISRNRWKADKVIPA
jgi:hypothetical protein